MPSKTTTVRRRFRFGASAAALALGTTLGVGALAAPATAAGQCVDYNYAQGGYSSCVGYAQQLLNFHMSMQGAAQLAVDNAFGPATRDAVVRTQQTFGLTVDGIIGPQTWNVICAPQMGPGPIAGFPYDAAAAAGC